LTLTISLTNEGPLGLKPLLNGEGKVIVEFVREGGQAAAGGIKVGDEIVKVSDAQMGGAKGAEDLLTILRGPNRPMAITIFRRSL